MAAAQSRPNLILMGIDSIRADHMSCYGYERLTTPHLDKFADSGTLFENTISAHIPTTSAYGSMLTGRDTFGTQVVALRHRGGLRPDIKTLPEMLRAVGYDTTCVGFTGNPSSRGFDTYLDYAAWGSWATGRSPKAQKLNEVAVPELERLAAGDRPFFLFLRHMDPHAPYLPPAPYERAFYHGNELAPDNRSMDPVMAFKPFRDFFRQWMPPGITDKDYVIAQYDGAIAYMDACIATLLESITALGLDDNTLVVINGDHGETLYDHECWFDHHGIYDNVLHVPLLMRFPDRVPAGLRLAGYNQHKDLVPTILDYLGEEADQDLDGRSLRKLVDGEMDTFETGIYITECTWMRKHGWRTPQFKYMHALEPDFHFKPEIELYDLSVDPEENHNIAPENPELCDHFESQIQAWIAKREAETGLPNPVQNQPHWHGNMDIEYFSSSQEAYDTLHIGDPAQGQRLQAGESED
ncbi:MAG: sulfatase-like hydrolase/transferase [Caldilineaceae bacterium SB0662_bin_9]|uniref:Sulfatase-like hydrolase/transferase n=1 Tax=Caldilineaceae bacterium SB0662_bin_9 TaxID=2605258 RepID=A0A6B1DPY1_9CHLR|nr:sulfatase [Caldilineaceae bacterium]MYD89191.1 sulfatase-like hydrolase/transferase [Caldilineaceae bacterium SB0662_bin_9]